MSRSSSTRSGTLSNTIRSILASRRLSLADVSRASRSRFPGNRLHHILHNFYSAISRGRFTPNVYQVVTLSVLSGYRFTDWLKLFGFSLDHVSRFQILFPALRTVELETRMYHPETEIAGVRDIDDPDFSPKLSPLSRWLTSAPARRSDALPASAINRFRYVKIGLQDDFAFPDLLPGSIVRVGSRPAGLQDIPVDKTPTQASYLVEHSRGLTCAPLCRPGRNRIVLCSRHLPYAPVELEEGTEAAVLGMAEVEIRPLNEARQPVVSRTMGQFWTPAKLVPPSSVRTFGEFIRRARERAGLSFREASERTRTVAGALRDSRYYCSPGSLSDLETSRFAPRQIHKSISICAVYFAGVAGLFSASGLLLDPAGLEIPAKFLESPRKPAERRAKPSQFLHEIEERFGEVPYFLHHALAPYFGLADLSFRDVFWIGGTREFVHRHLSGALFLVVDRKQKKPRPSLSSPKWAQPLYVLQHRDGSYLFGFCSLQNNTLILRSAEKGLPPLMRLRRPFDAEVIGKVVGIVRKIA